MRASAMARASFVALAVLAMTTDSTLARNAEGRNVVFGNLNIKRIDPNDPYAVKACTDSGGTVKTDEHGIKICDRHDNHRYLPMEGAGQGK